MFFWVQAQCTFHNTSCHSWKQTGEDPISPNPCLGTPAQHLSREFLCTAVAHSPTLNDCNHCLMENTLSRKKDFVVIFLNSWLLHFHNSCLERHESKEVGIRPSISGPHGACLNGSGPLGLRIRKLLATGSTRPFIEK
jgi:hypothetical protein